MALSAVWLVVYLTIYPSIPLITSHWQGVGVPGGCRPWTAICEMRLAQAKLDSVRGPYLEKLSSAALETIATDRALCEFVSRAARVPYAEQCAGCHGREGAGYSQIKSLAPSLTDTVWLHGSELRDIKASILDAAIHPFGLAARTDELHARLLAVYIYKGLR
jgi:cytochrome c oxidase cbb3-type subunit 3